MQERRTLSFPGSDIAFPTNAHLLLTVAGIRHGRPAPRGGSPGLGAEVRNGGSALDRDVPERPFTPVLPSLKDPAPGTPLPGTAASMPVPAGAAM